MNQKIKPLPLLKNTLRRLKGAGKKIVFTNGCFDILHRGHVEYLKKAKGLGDILVVGLNNDASVRRLKGGLRPITPKKDRAAVLAALSCVDFVAVFSEDTPLRLIRQLAPDILVKGADWAKVGIVGRAFVESRGGEVKTIKYLKGYSTSNLIKKIGAALIA